MQDIIENSLGINPEIVETFTAKNGDVLTIQTDGKGNYGVFVNGLCLGMHSKRRLDEMALDSARGHFVSAKEWRK